MQFIYGLYSTEDNLIRYVGKTNSLNSRLASHKYDALKRNSKNHKCNWIRSVYENKHEIGIKLIEVCDDVNVNEREKYWIKALKESNNLTNELEGGQSGGIGGKMKEYKTFDEMKKWMSINYPNVKTFKQYQEIPKNVKDKNKLPLSPQIVYVKRGTWGGINLLFNTNKTTKPKDVNSNDILLFIKFHSLQNYKEYKKQARKFNFPINIKDYVKNHKINIDFDGIFNDRKKIKDIIKICEIIKKERITTIKEYHQKYIELSNKYNDYYFPYHLKRCLNIDYKQVLYKKEISEEVFKRYVHIYFRNIKNTNEWLILSKEGKLNKRIPKRPDTKYKKPWSYFFPNIKPSKKKIICT